VKKLGGIGLSTVSLPKGFVRKVKKMKADQSVIRLMDERAPRGEQMLAGFYDQLEERGKAAKADKEYMRSLHQQKMDDKLLWWVMAEYYRVLQSGLEDDGGGWLIDGSLEMLSVLRTGELRVKPKGVDQFVAFDLRNFHKALAVLKDKRLKHIIEHYLPQELAEAPIPYEEIKKGMMRVDREQLEVVNLVLLLEKENLIHRIATELRITNKAYIGFYLEAEAPHPKSDVYKAYESCKASGFARQHQEEIDGYLESLLDGEDLNRIAPRTLIEEEDLVSSYRNKAFHNELPELSRFTPGIEKLKEALETIKGKG